MTAKYVRTQHRFETVPSGNGLNRIVLHRLHTVIRFSDGPLPLTRAARTFVPPRLPEGTSPYSARGAAAPSLPPRFIRRSPENVGELVDPEMAVFQIADLRRRRVALGLSQEKLSKALYYTRSAVGDLERGRFRLTQVLYERADAYLSALEEERQ